MVRPLLMLTLLLPCALAEERPCASMRTSRENPTPELNENSFQKLFDLCRPRASKEAWTEVLWVGEFWEARQKAARLGKPLFLFAMNGHPLGCV